MIRTLLLSLLLAAPVAAQDAELNFKSGKGIPDADLGLYQVVMECAIDGEPAGEMVFGFWPEKAPISVRNFLRYANDGLYDGVEFHRIMKGFMIQGGDPSGSGRGKGKYGRIPGEFSNNNDYDKAELGRAKKYQHVYGVLSMARTNDPNSATSQFFVCNARAQSLDNNYASFGIMLRGKETLDKLSNVKCKKRGRELSDPIPKVEMSKVYVVRNGDSRGVADFETGKGIPDADLGKYRVKIQCALEGEDIGEMVFELWPDKAPVTVRNFLRYASEGAYNGRTFHRIMKGFMIQGGCPRGDGGGKGKYEAIPLEASSDGKYSHTYGVLSMARTADPNSATCQFFVCNADASMLDGQYASFGKMISGNSTLDKITHVPTVKGPGGEASLPTSKVTMRVSLERNDG